MMRNDSLRGFTKFAHVVLGLIVCLLPCSDYTCSVGMFTDQTAVLVAFNFVFVMANIVAFMALKHSNLLQAYERTFLRIAIVSFFGATLAAVVLAHSESPWSQASENDFSSYSRMDFFAALLGAQLILYLWEVYLVAISRNNTDPDDDEKTIVVELKPQQQSKTNEHGGRGMFCAVPRNLKKAYRALTAKSRRRASQIMDDMSVYSLE